MNFFRTNLKLSSTFAALAFIILCLTAVSAQTRMSSYRGVSNVNVGLIAGQTIRVTMHNPFSPSSGTSGGPRVRVFDGNGGLLLEKDAVLIPGGAFASIDISRGDFADPGEERTGRLQVRVEIELLFRTASTDDPVPSFPTSFEVVKDDNGEAILIGLLLPAVQKVR